ncbi:carbamoyl-phosphate synthase L chain, ATP binding domain-containing protein [Aspergillus ambiguus]|uniref:putative pyruvate carboxylase n=1 Tax=Aspergillus ambiguus TaxID=176160 RepID=UPI003CCC8F9D
MAAQRIQRLLVANRGEIAVRILQAAREVSPSIETFALYTEDDRSHCDLGRPHHALPVPSAAAYLDIALLVELAQKHQIDTIHPGYGFLSESAEFARRMHDVGVAVIGPGAATLARTGDKLQAKQLAMECSVPVLPAMERPTADLAEIRAFARQTGYPVMIKAVDGGGGRGIRLVRREEELENAVRGATGESSSQTVFVEKAAVDGYHHIEVQVVGDGSDVRHLWERDCSVQRRFQKVVEVAPSLLQNRPLIQQVVNSALRMAKAIHYRSLGTVEFLVHEHQEEFYFLEINPRLQVEHTITENVTGFDLVQTQLRLAQGQTLAQVGLGKSPPTPTSARSIQLRLCSEDPRRNFSLSLGKITEFSVPGGHGVRVDTHVDMSGAAPVIVGANFDNLLAKIIVTASNWEGVVFKARRVLTDTRISGVQTNLDLLRGIVAQDDFLAGRIDTQWLERHLQFSLEQGEKISQSVRRDMSTQPSRTSTIPSIPASSLLFRGGDAWSVKLEPLGGADQPPQQHHFQLTRVLQNDFPSSLAAEVEYTTPTSSTAYRLQLATTSTSANALVSSSHRRGDPNNPRHIVLPLSGKLIEVLVGPGEVVAENQVLAFVKQMKMELEVRSPRAGRAHWVYEMEDEEEDVAEGMLLVELEEELRGKL